MNIDQRLRCYAANYIEMGDPQTAGKGIADIVKFLLRRIDESKRSSAIERLKMKILNLNESEISSKKTPPSASLGQSITFIKTILIGHDPAYIRQVLNFIYRNL